MDTLSVLIVDAVAFGRHVLGIMTRPYETYRHIVKYGKPGELVYVAVLLMVYFALASIVKVAEFRPFLLTQQFVVLCLGALSGAVLSAGTLFFTGRLFGARSSFVTLFVAWSYTLLPTVTWFFATSLLYVILPPPRTTSVLGVLFSLLFLVFSVMLLWWKVTLSYLTIRFSLRLNLWQSAAAALICAPVIAFWAFLMYTSGIFKVPFL